MGLHSLFSRSSDLEPGDIIEVLDESGDTVEATYEGMGQYVERERIVSKKAEPQPKDAW